MKVGILGSGFGLYGYLPALLELGQRPVLPRRYREKLEARSDVQALAQAIEWVPSDDDVLGDCEWLVVTKRPADQVDLVNRSLKSGRIGHYLLEKPLAPDPASARRLLDAMKAAGTNVRMGFLFRFTPWAEAVRSWLADAGPGAEVRVEWRFRAHHFREGIETWKRRPSAGGGVLRFYGIHLVALLAELGYQRVEESRVTGTEPDDARQWRARLIGERLPTCTVAVDSDCHETTFLVCGLAGNGDERLRIELQDPFDKVSVRGAFDRRVEPLVELCGEFLTDAGGIPPWYDASIDLWAATES